MPKAETESSSCRRLDQSPSMVIPNVISPPKGHPLLLFFWIGERGMDVQSHTCANPLLGVVMSWSCTKKLECRGRAGRPASFLYVAYCPRPKIIDRYCGSNDVEALMLMPVGKYTRRRSKHRGFTARVQDRGRARALMRPTPKLWRRSEVRMPQGLAATNLTSNIPSPNCAIVPIVLVDHPQIARTPCRGGAMVLGTASLFPKCLPRTNSCGVHHASSVGFAIHDRKEICR
ncbi:hypothetical protein BC628DRAFT_1381878 [Trametes gibbosa]|nr:hypothetical protein BC628DRAFT_1381878 [Trametes gibbosa]